MLIWCHMVFFFRALDNIYFSSIYCPGNEHVLTSKSRSLWKIKPHDLTTWCAGWEPVFWYINFYFVLLLSFGVGSITIHIINIITLTSIQLSTDEGLWDILIKDIPKEVTSYTLNLDMLREGVTYDFRVIGVNDYGYGSPSAPSPSIAGEES